MNETIKKLYELYPPLSRDILYERSASFVFFNSFFKAALIKLNASVGLIVVKYGGN